jgi:hypothetical protein
VALDVQFRGYLMGRLTAPLVRERLPCIAGHLLRVRLTEFALCLNDCASDRRFRLS